MNIKQLPMNLARWINYTIFKPQLQSDEKFLFEG